MHLQMDVPGAGRRRDVIDRLRIARIAHVDDAEALREHVADIGEAALDHDLHAVRPAALVGISEQAHVAGVVGSGEVLSHPANHKARRLTALSPLARESRRGGSREALSAASPSPPSPQAGGGGETFYAAKKFGTAIQSIMAR